MDVEYVTLPCGLVVKLFKCSSLALVFSAACKMRNPATLEIGAHPFVEFHVEFKCTRLDHK
ncbi:hypothetical protein BDP81DRAFT_441367 [Colletotrichum phormii]|uniref:Uncharacterized protein n=1 Tax=Colletotrichum phormii TaxID=359342 RepID=A0AAI9ZE13_9PEZI|nr:uncharacterized protein BDP81DRAFT_441367 [Colletotrichum phormii]KAK1622537.1 hypothetical protein BDP81DRAFT_441367 [Colletotrichum phormii]